MPNTIGHRRRLWALWSISSTAFAAVSVLAAVGDVVDEVLVVVVVVVVVVVAAVDACDGDDTSTVDDVRRLSVRKSIGRTGRTCRYTAPANVPANSQSNDSRWGSEGFAADSVGRLHCQTSAVSPSTVGRRPANGALQIVHTVDNSSPRTAAPPVS